MVLSKQSLYNTYILESLAIAQVSLIVHTMCREGVCLELHVSPVFLRVLLAQVFCHTAIHANTNMLCI